jgi:hypothetical protein
MVGEGPTIHVFPLLPLQSDAAQLCSLAEHKLVDGRPSPTMTA